VSDSIQTLQPRTRAAATAPQDTAWQLLPALQASAEAGRAAQRAAAALTDTLAACRHLPADIYRYAPDVFQTARTLTAAGRALTGAVHTATAARTPDTVHAVHQALNTLLHATAATDVTTDALRTAAAWYTAALPAPAPR
jgi:hypothetical protein